MGEPAGALPVAARTSTSLSCLMASRGCFKLEYNVIHILVYVFITTGELTGAYEYCTFCIRLCSVLAGNQNSTQHIREYVFGTGSTLFELVGDFSTALSAVKCAKILER